MTAATDKPLVSMIVVCYNQARWVLETLESVRAQTYKHTELIIVDDCSTDDSVAIIDRWLQQTGIPCNFIRHEKNMGVCPTVNDAVRAATGKYISMIASDDLWLPDKIERQVEIMEAQPEDVGVVYSQVFQIDEEGNGLPGMHPRIPPGWDEMPQGKILETVMGGWFLMPQAVLLRRGCYDTVGLYDEGLPIEDWDMFMRIARHYSFVYSTAPSAKYRTHAKQLTRRDPGRMLRDSVKVSLKHFRSGDLSDEQNRALLLTTLRFTEGLYELKDRHTPDILKQLWQLTRSRKALRMYRSLKLGIPYSVWSGQLWRREKAAWAIRNYIWFPLLKVTRPIRHSLGVNHQSFRALLRRRK